MAEKLMHLPTKPTMVYPTAEKPFVRRQHYQPNQREAAPKEGAKAKETNQPNQSGTASIVPNRLVKLQPISKEPKQPGVQLQPEHRPPSFEERFQPKSEQLQRGESIMDAGLPETLTPEHQFEPVGTKTVNGVYTFEGDNGYRFYWKPKEEEMIGFRKSLEQNELLRALNPKGSVRDTIDGNFGGREIATYELSKMLGVEGLVPPTREFDHAVGGGEADMYHGPAQMSAHDFGTRLLGHNKVQHGAELLNTETMDALFSKSDNGHEMVLFDFLTGNTDRHGANFFAGKTKEGQYHFIGNDNGLTHPEHESDIMHPDWEGSLETWHNFFKSNARSKPISDNFLAGILGFDEAAYRKMAGEQGIGEKAQTGVVDRVKMVQDVVRSKYLDAAKKYENRDWNSIEERRETLKKETTFSGDDLEQVIRTNMMTTQRADGSEKYTKKEMGSTWQSPKDWTNQIKYVFEGMI